jgi:F-type H+-transporting ATPase subunit delta
MATLIGELIGMAVVFWVLFKYVAPPVRKLMAKQQETVRAQIEASEKAKADLADAERKHSAAVEEARVESARIREDARADSQRISTQLREQADVEVERIRQQGQEQIVLQRQQLIRSLKADLGAEAIAEADRRVRQELSDPAAKSSAVDGLLGELEAMAGEREDAKNSGVL